MEQTQKHSQASTNQLSGPIPFNIGKLQKLKIFYNERNFHTGTIPHSIGNLSELTKLLLNGNNFQGNIPSSLGKCQNLLVMDISDNQLNGPIPPEVIGLSSLSILLNLSSNLLTEELPGEVEKLKNLAKFDVSQNRLSGLLPNSLGGCVSLAKLFLEGNLFEGPIPSSLSSLRGLESLDMSDNNLSGGIPEFLVNFRALKYLNLSFNDFEGVVPNEGVFKNASVTFIEGNKKLCGGIPELHLSRCNSKTSKSGLKIAMIVVILGATLVFTCILILWFRKKEEKKPTTTCVENSLLPLSYQSILRATDGFNEQNLIGSGSFGSVYKAIIEDSGATIAVKVFDLLNRRASRSFLTEYEALKNIRHRNLVKVLTAVSGVDYKGNDFKALIYEFMENESLEDWLHPSITMNEPGTMMLSGLLPNNLGSCVGLSKLFLKGNLFEGSIPSTLSSLRGLESLDVSDNNLSGAIPEFLVNFGALKYLNLSFNDFEGVVPNEGVFKNASATFLEGNKKLCGGIPELHLSRCNSKTSKSGLKIAIIVVILGATLAFTGILILWFRKKEEKKPTTTCEENSLLQLSYQSILRATDGFNEQNLIGSGSFGSVYKAIIEDSGATIAVKVFDLLNRRASRSFLAECEALKNVRHRNLVKVLTAVSGADYKGNDFKALVYEFMGNGSLEDWLHPSITMNEPGTMRSLNFFQRVDVAIVVAHALEYLHHRCDDLPKY
ncbi:hypothetical protein GQ457_12G031740 [Hibiscus cannabinus]